MSCGMKRRWIYFSLVTGKDGKIRLICEEDEMTESMGASIHHLLLQ